MPQTLARVPGAPPRLAPAIIRPNFRPILDLSRPVGPASYFYYRLNLLQIYSRDAAPGATTGFGSSTR